MRRTAEGLLEGGKRARFLKWKRTRNGFFELSWVATEKDFYLDKKKMPMMRSHVIKQQTQEMTI